MDNAKILSSLKQVDQALAYFSLTSRCQQIRFNQLQKLCNGLIDISDLDTILSLWPEAYHTTKLESGDSIISLGGSSSANISERQLHMQKILDSTSPDSVNALSVVSTSKLNTLCSPIKPSKITKTPSKPSRAAVLHKTPKSLTEIANQKVATNTANGLSLAERIKLKELLRQQETNVALTTSEESKSKSIELTIIHGYLEQISLILLSMQCRSYPLPYIATKLSDSLRSKLSTSESENALLELSRIVPEFCSIISAGRVHAVKLKSGWDLEKIKQRIVRV